MRNHKSRTSRRKYIITKRFKLFIGITITFILLIGSLFFLHKNVQATHNINSSKFESAQLAKHKDNSSISKPVQVSTTTNDQTTNISSTAQAESNNNASSQTAATTPVETPPSTAVTADGSKIAYLTFDDGPSGTNTPKILSILKNMNVKATFFVIGKMAEERPDLLKEEVADGHIIGNHTYSHSLDYNHSTPEAFMSDFKKGEAVITSIIGNHDKSLIRFPGGSFNRTAYQNAAHAAGYRYVDWNCLTGDAEVALSPADRLLRRFNETFSNQKNLIVLMHDAPNKVTTPEVLPQIIELLKAKGYVFKTF